MWKLDLPLAGAGSHPRMILFLTVLRKRQRSLGICATVGCSPDPDCGIQAQNVPNDMLDDG